MPTANLQPSGPGFITQCQPSGDALNYKCVQVAGDGKSVQTGAPFLPAGWKDMYVTPPLPATAAAVVSFKTVIWSSDAEDIPGSNVRFQPFIRLAGLELTALSVKPAATLTKYTFTWPTKPGGGAWTVADVNACEIGHLLAIHAPLTAGPEILVDLIEKECEYTDPVHLVVEGDVFLAAAEASTDAALGAELAGDAGPESSEEGDAALDGSEAGQLTVDATEAGSVVPEVTRSSDVPLVEEP